MNPKPHRVSCTVAISFATVLMLLGLLNPQSHASDAPNAYENQLTLKASRILRPELLSGPDFKVDETVVNEGFLNHYRIESAFGQFTAVSTFILKKRVHEIAAIAAMKKIDTSDTVADSALDSGQDTIAGIKHLFTEPDEALKGAGAGVTSLFYRAKEAVTSDPSQTEDSRVEQLIGLSKSKRDIAVRFGVDVYSENEVLQKELNRLAWADYSGGLGVAAATAAIPGVGGAVLSVSNTARLLNEVINVTPPTELRHRNRGKLTAMGIDSDTIELFINNGAFSPRHQTWLVESLEKLKGTDNRDLFLKVALQANDSTTALVITEVALMCAGYHAKIAPLAHFYPVARILYAVEKSGKTVLIVPADLILWSERFAGAVAEIQQKSKGHKAELWVTGQVSRQSRENLTRAGWSVHENIAAKLEEKVK